MRNSPLPGPARSPLLLEDSRPPLKGVEWVLVASAVLRLCRALLTLIGDNHFVLIGPGAQSGYGRVRARHGAVRLTATDPRLGSQTIELVLSAVPVKSISRVRS